MASKSDAQDTIQSSQTTILESSTHYHPREQSIDEDVAREIAGYNHAQMKARALLSYDEEKKLLRRVDWRLMPLCALIFMVKNVDANNAANARIMNRGTPRNILTQLNMTGDEYNFVSSIYFIPFIVFEIPSLLILKKMRPSRFQSRIMVTWGIALACHAAVTSKSGLYVARFFLGLCEAGMFPGIILQLTYWYRTDEMTMRLLVFYSFEFFANVVSAVLAFGFDNISGRCDLSGWQWFFLVEGVITIAFGATLWFILPDYPGNFERRAVMALHRCFRDKDHWIFRSFVLPTIVADLGLVSIAESQLLTIPSAVVPMFLIALSSYLTNYRRVPMPLMTMIFMIVTLACYGVLYVYPSTGQVYAATIIAGSASNAWFPTIWPWRLQTTSRATGSAFAIGLVNSLGQIGSVIGPQIFRSKYAPEYTVSFAVAIGFSALCVVLTCWTWWMTRVTEKRTRELRTLRMAAAKRGEIILDDVDIAADFEKSEEPKGSGRV